MITIHTKKLIPDLAKRNESVEWKAVLIYQFVHHVVVAFLALEIAALHWEAKAAFPSGVDALFSKSSRSPSKLALNPGAFCGAFSVIVARQASYLVMYSLHS